MIELKDLIIQLLIVTKCFLIYAELVEVIKKAGSDKVQSVAATNC